MQFERKTSIGRDNSLIKLLVKIAAVLVLFFVVIIMVDKIDFPSPNKKIEKIISNENLKIVK
jgi:hypothetical protein